MKGELEERRCGVRAPVLVLFLYLFFLKKKKFGCSLFANSQGICFGFYEPLYMNILER